MPSFLQNHLGPIFCARAIDIYSYLSIKTPIKEHAKDKIAIIYAEGPIAYLETSGGDIVITPENISQKLSELNKISNLKGVVLRVNSPGGSALGAEMIYKALSDIRVPIYVSMGSTAASGGYYISMAGKKVFANNATITGSIGVVSMLPKAGNFQNKYGITSNSITKGKYADIYDIFTPLTQESRNRISESMNETYKEFKSRVSENRQIPETVLENYAQGKIWLGEEAISIKLIDNIASLEETVRILAKDLSLGDNYNVRSIYSKRDFSETLKLLSSYIIEKMKLTSQLEILYKNGQIVNDYKLIESNKNKPMYYLPYKLDLY